jgi:prepilin-type N-terminal cleavage/methylation domain-containing protein
MRRPALGALRDGHGRRPHGFGLIEVIVALAIVAILMSIALPGYRRFLLRSHRIEAMHALLELQGSQVKVAGGKTTDHDTRSAEVYDIATGLFHDAGSMSTSRSLFTATLLNNGKVLVAAGRHGGTPTPKAELFDPVFETFSDTGSMKLQRKRHRAVLLQDGKVLVSGGAALSNNDQPNEGTPTAETYDPDTGAFIPTADMNVGRTEHEATMLPDGRVLQSGGRTIPAPADIYVNTTRSFNTSGELILERYRHRAVFLSNPAWGSLTGQVLIIGGAVVATDIFGGIAQALDSVEIYDPTSGKFSSFGTLTVARQNHTATLLNDGRILITGGVGRPFVSGTAELLRP